MFLKHLNFAMDIITWEEEEMTMMMPFNSVIMFQMQWIRRRPGDDVDDDDLEIVIVPQEDAQQRELSPIRHRLFTAAAAPHDDDHGGIPCSTTNNSRLSTVIETDAASATTKKSRTNTNIRYGILNSMEPHQSTMTAITTTSDNSNNDTLTVSRVSIDNAIERLGMGCFQHRILVAAGLCFAADAMEVLLLSFLAIVLQAEWGLSQEQTATLTCSVFIGSIAGSLLFGYMGDVIGRKPAFVWTATIICIFGFGTAAANSYMALVVFRFMVGLGVGGVTVPFDIFAEVCPKANRGGLLLLLGYFWTAGTILVVVVAFISLRGDVNDWRIFVALCGIPCLVSSLSAFVYVPESPRWLLAQGRGQEALEILRMAARVNGKDSALLFPPGTLLYQEDGVAADDFTDFSSESLFILFQPQWLKMTILLWSIWATFGYTYYSTVTVLTEIFASEDVSRQGGNNTGTYSFDFGAILMSALSEVAGTTIGFLFVDRFGRIPCQVIPHVAGGVSVCLACILASSDTEHSSSMRTLLIFLAFLARMFFMCGSSVAWISTAEILSSQVRATGHSSANAINKLSGALSPFLVVTNTKSRYPTIGVVLLLVSLVTAACASMLPETKGKIMGTHTIMTVVSAAGEGDEGLQDEAEELSPADHRGTLT